MLDDMESMVQLIDSLKLADRYRSRIHFMAKRCGRNPAQAGASHAIQDFGSVLWNSVQDLPSKGLSGIVEGWM